MIDYDGFRATQREARAAAGLTMSANGEAPTGMLPGIGLAVYVEPSAIGRGPGGLCGGARQAAARRR